MKKLSYEKQQQLLVESTRTGEPLADVLAKHGYDYDSLVYRAHAKDGDFRDAKQFVPVDERPAIASGIPCVSFFSGAGGLDIGFTCAGFNTVVNVEINKIFCDTLRTNGSKIIVGPPFANGDMNNPNEVISHLKKIGIPKNFPGVFHGGPPCQSFSIAANQRFSKNGTNFKRTGFLHEKYGNLLFCYIDVIIHFMPEVFLIENVDGLLTIDDGEQVKKACEMLTNAGYDVTPPRVVNAADYGVPQKRLRTLIVGSRIGHFIFPEPSTHQLSSGRVFLRPLTDAINHVTRNHNAGSVQRYMKLDFGERDKTGRVDRLDPSRPSKTIIAGGTGGGGRSHLHPYIPRTMSVRECARLQTFPDGYKFSGPVARQFTQVGNAVPPVLAYVMACAIHTSIYAPIPKHKVAEDLDLTPLTDTIKASPTQLTLFEKECLYVVCKTPLTLLGTYRKVCREWIVEKSLYNYPVTDEDLNEHPELKKIKHLILKRQNDQTLYFSVTCYSIVTKNALKKLGYPVNAKHSAKTKYILYTLKKLNVPIPVFKQKEMYIVGKGVT